MDNDLISAEMSYAFREYSLENDNSSLYSVARTIMKLQSLYGLIPHIKYVGAAAQTVHGLLSDMRHQVQANI